MGEYRIWQCRKCGTTVLAEGSKSWGGFQVVNEVVACCKTPDIGWIPGQENEITLPDNEAIPEPEFPRQSRITLVLEDIAHG